MSELAKEITKREVQLEYAFEHFISFESRKIVISGEIGAGLFKFVSMALTELEAVSKRKITIEIHSGGGDVYEALAVIGRMKNCPCKIWTVGYGYIMSAATGILAAGDVRMLSKYAQVMVHQSQTRVSGSISEMSEELSQYHKEEVSWCKMLEDMTNTPVNEWLPLHTKTTYLKPEECLQLGLIDRII